VKELLKTFYVSASVWSITERVVRGSSEEKGLKQVTVKSGGSEARKTPDRHASAEKPGEIHMVVLEEGSAQ